jgi:hypothetical protein
MTERQKCQKCGVNNAKHGGLTFKIIDTNETDRTYDYPLCEPCYQEILKCQECKTNKCKAITTKHDGEKARVCSECLQKVQEVKESIQKGKEIKARLEEYLEDGEHRFDDGKVVKVLGEIKKNLTKDQLLAFKKLLEDNMTGEPSPTNGGQWLG